MMLRLLVVAENDAQETEMVARARAVLGDLSPDREVEVVVVPVTPASTVEARLDAGLFLRPLPDGVIVVGRADDCATSGLVLLTNLLDARRDVEAIIPGDHPGTPVSALLETGAGFRAGPLCQAGGFGGDGIRSVQDRLAALGFDAAMLSYAPSVASPVVVDRSRPVVA